MRSTKIEENGEHQAGWRDTHQREAPPPLDYPELTPLVPERTFYFQFWIR